MKRLFTILTIILFMTNIVSAGGFPENDHPFKTKMQTKKEEMKMAMQGQMKLNLSGTRIFNGNPGNSSDYDWFGVEWYHSMNSEYIYDEDGNLVVLISTDPSSGMNLYKDNYTFDEHGNIIEVMSYVFGGAVWDPSFGSRNNYTYDENGNITEVNFQFLDIVSGAWQNVNRNLSTYDDNGCVIIEIYQYWSDDAWMNEYKDEYTYNASGEWDTVASFIGVENNWEMDEQVIDIVWYDWSKEQLGSAIIQLYSDGMWNNDEKLTGTYDGDEYVMIYEMFLDDMWTLYERETYSIVNMEHTTLWESHDSQNWVNSDRDTEFYDDHQIYSGSKHEYWETGKSTQAEWVIEHYSKIDHTYDESDNLTERVFRTWDSQTLELVNLQKSVFSNFGSSDIPEMGADLGLRIYPNPAGNELNILDLNEGHHNLSFYLIDTRGQILQTGMLNNGNPKLDLSKMASGVYFLNVSDETNQSASYKVLKR